MTISASIDSKSVPTVYINIVSHKDRIKSLFQKKKNHKVGKMSKITPINLD